MKYEIYINDKKVAEVEGKDRRPGLVELPVIEVKHGDKVDMKVVHEQVHTVRSEGIR